MNLKGKSLTREILFIVATGPIILSSLFLPNAAQILKPLLKWRKNWDIIDRKRIYEAIERLNQKRLVEIIQKEDELYIKITKNGKNMIRNFDYDNLALPEVKKWDQKWRLVMFDVPDKRKKERLALSKKLKDLGFYPLQESVFVYPYDCQDEVDFVCAFLSIGRYVNYGLIEMLDKKEGDLRKFFNLEIL